MDSEFLPYQGTKEPKNRTDLLYDEKKSISDVKVAEEGSESYDHGDDILDVKGDDKDPLYAALPQIVREICTFEDDVDMPVLTWRFYFISAIFVALGAYVLQSCRLPVFVDSLLTNDVQMADANGFLPNDLYSLLRLAPLSVRPALKANQPL